MTDALDLLRRGLELTKWNTLSDAGIEVKWMEAHGQVAELTDSDWKYGITRFPYEPGQALISLAGGFFDHPEWPLRKSLEKHASMRAIAEYEAKYINCIGYLLEFNNSATDLQMELIPDDSDSAHRFAVWAYMSV